MMFWKPSRKSLTTTLNINWFMQKITEFPQNRPRVLIIGIRKDLNISVKEDDDALENGFLPEPTNDYPNIVDVFSDLIDKKFEYGGKTIKYPSNPKNFGKKI